MVILAEEAVTCNYYMLGNNHFGKAYQLIISRKHGIAKIVKNYMSTLVTSMKAENCLVGGSTNK